LQKVCDVKCSQVTKNHSMNWHFFRIFALVTVGLLCSYMYWGYADATSITLLMLVALYLAAIMQAINDLKYHKEVKFFRKIIFISPPKSHKFVPAQLQSCWVMRDIFSDCIFFKSVMSCRHRSVSCKQG